MKWARGLHLLAILASVSCSEAGFQGGSGGKGVTTLRSPSGESVPGKSGAGNPQAGAPSGEGINGGTDSGTNGGTGGQSTGQATQMTNPCANQSRNFSVLIVDLKSGWFAGDGGDFFQSVVNSVCGDSKVSVSYVHITRSNSVSNVALDSLLDCHESESGFLFFKSKRQECTALKDVRGFDQFWLLTGDQHDDEDLPLSTPLFGSIVARARELRDAKPDAGFYFGAGLGNIHHGNALAAALFPEFAGSGGNAEVGLFAPTGGDRGTLPNPRMAEEEGSRVLLPGNGSTAGTFDAGAFPFREFAGLPALTSLFDYERCVTDAVTPAASGGNPRVVATDFCGKKAIVQFVVGKHKIVADGNTARFYGFPEYFRRNVLLLLP